MIKKYLSLLLLLSLFAGGVAAADENNGTAPALKLYPYENGLGAAGYDVVAYFKEDAATEGDERFETEFGGVPWRFKSAENRDEFLANPEKYLPRFGGHCAYAAALDALAYGDPTIWSIRDSVLYFNYNEPTRETWLGNVEEYIRNAEKNWPALSRRN